MVYDPFAHAAAAPHLFLYQRTCPYPYMGGVQRAQGRTVVLLSTTIGPHLQRAALAALVAHDELQGPPAACADYPQLFLRLDRATSLPAARRRLWEVAAARLLADGVLRCVRCHLERLGAPDLEALALSLQVPTFILTFRLQQPEPALPCGQHATEGCLAVSDAARSLIDAQIASSSTEQLVLPAPECGPEAQRLVARRDFPGRRGAQLREGREPYDPNGHQDAARASGQAPELLFPLKREPIRRIPSALA